MITVQGLAWKEKQLERQEYFCIEFRVALLTSTLTDGNMAEGWQICHEIVIRIKNFSFQKG